MSAFQNTSGDITITVGPSGTNVFTINGDLTVTGNASLTGNIAGDKIYSGSSNVVIAGSSGNVAISVGGTSNVLVVASTGVAVTGTLSTTGNVVSPNVSVTGTLTAANLSLTGNIVNDLFVSGNITGNIINSTNYVATPALVVSGNIATVTSAGYPIGYREVPQLALSSNVVANLTNSGKHFYSTTAGNLAVTIPSNANVAFNIGTQMQIVVQAAGNVIVDTQAGVTLYQAGNSTSGNRTVGSYGRATLLKVATDTWFIDGTGIV